jgi:diguanylate cyclase (GGDEF)-like protein
MPAPTPALTHDQHAHQLAAARNALRTLFPLSFSTLLIPDVDNFKLVNDTLGHLVGDEVLREVSRRLLEAVRSYDYVGRYGGEEFLMVLSNCDNCSPLDRAEEIRRSICHTPIPTSRGELFITISIGVLASREWSQLSTEEMVRQADSALYAAKAAGRNCCRLISSNPCAESTATGSQRKSQYDESCHSGPPVSRDHVILTTRSSRTEGGHLILIVENHRVRHSERSEGLRAFWYTVEFKVLRALREPQVAPRSQQPKLAARRPLLPVQPREP